MGSNEGRSGASRLGEAPLRCARAQSTVEFAVVLSVLVAVLAACMLLANAASDGALAQAVEDAASHGLSGLGWVDIALY